ncbi:dopamine beta-hydroxylase-like [Argopecten irradians]|uniref:dopamine beta-hydroxylase-like n=1 Tax=Argopecten irradians TaxID=31199 RepID=UPI00371CFD4B
MRSACLLLILKAIVFSCIHGYPSFQSLIPNGNKLTDPCNGSTPWPGVGHEAMGGGGLLNPFGHDFNITGKVWNTALCEMDSDGDGVSNGEELGDPNCEWTPGLSPAGQPTGHPGVCEPWSDPLCLQKNRFYQCMTENFTCDAINDPDVRDLVVRFPVTQVPVEETTYMCMNFALPADQDYHVIADRGSIDNQFVIHHIIVHGCTVDDVTELNNPLMTPYACGMAGEQKCREMFAGWSVGMEGFCHHEDAGVRIGPTGYRYAVMQMHWNNPTKERDQTDSSGMTLYYTPVLRQYDLGNLMIGEHIFRIPPGESSYTVESECSSSSSASLMNSSIYIISGLNHMHYMGKTMTTYHTPSGGVEQAIMDDPHYSYDNPVTHTFPTPLKVNPGDALRTKCTFSSLRKALTTTSGESTSQEMCYSFLFYYPKTSFEEGECTTVMGLPLHLVRDDTKLIEGCQLKSFLGNLTNFEDMFNKLTTRCEPFFCRKECKEYLMELGQNPCLQGKVKAYVDYLLNTNGATSKMALYHSCDTEIALEGVEPCTCTTA